MSYSIRVFCPTCNDIFPLIMPEHPTDDFDLDKAKCTHCNKMGLKQLQSNLSE